MVEMERKKGSLNVTVCPFEGVGRAKVGFRSPSIAYVCGFRGSDRSRIGVRFSKPFDLTRLPAVAPFVSLVLLQEDYRTHQSW